MLEVKDPNSQKSCVVMTGFLIGGHVMRLCHGHDESLTIPGADKSEEEQRWASSTRSSQDFLQFIEQEEVLSKWKKKSFVLQWVHMCACVCLPSFLVSKVGSLQ